MRRDELDDQLRSWGFAQMNRFDLKADAVNHPIARAREFAPMTRKRAALRLAGRDGESRRRAMAQASGVKGMTIAPKWSTDPVRCTETRNAGPVPDTAAAVDAGVPEDLRWIDRAVSQLYRVNMVRALCLREEYCGTGSHAEKAASVERAYGGVLTVRQFRYELTLAREWLRGRKAAP